MDRYIFVIFLCILLLISNLLVTWGEDDRYLICSYTQEENFHEIGWCRPVKLNLEEQVELQVERIRARYHDWTHIENLHNGPNFNCTKMHIPYGPKSEIQQYVGTIITPFLELHRNGVRDAYNQMSYATHQRTQKEMTAALATKDQMYEESKQLILELQVPDYCAEEKRAARRVAHQLVAAVARCVERAQHALAKMKSYLEEMIALTKKYLSLVENLKLHVENCSNATSCIEWLSAISVQLGYELEATAAHARSHQDVSTDKLDACVSEARTAVRAEHDVVLKHLHYCVET